MPKQRWLRVGLLLVIVAFGCTGETGDGADPQAESDASLSLACTLGTTCASSLPLLPGAPPKALPPNAGTNRGYWAPDPLFGWQVPHIAQTMTFTGLRLDRDDVSVWLASTSDGRGALAADDVVLIEVRNSSGMILSRQILTGSRLLLADRVTPVPTRPSTWDAARNGFVAPPFDLTPLLPHGRSFQLKVSVFDLGNVSANDPVQLVVLPRPSPDAGVANRQNFAFLGQHLHSLVGAADGGRTIYPPPSGARPNIGTVRTWDSNVGLWASIQPNPTTWDWSRLDEFIDTANANQAEVIFTIGPGTPTWASARPTESFVYGIPGGRAEPADLAAFETYLTELFTRYRGRVQTYEVWNEPDFSGGLFFSGTKEALFQIHQVVATTLRRVDPTARLLGPGFVNASRAGGAFAEYLAFTGPAYAQASDGVAFHFYVNTPEQTLDVQRRVAELMSDAGIGALPLFNTEGGWASKRRFPTEPSAVDEARIPGYFARNALLGLYAGFERSCYYSYDGYSGRFSEAETGVLLPLGVAQQQVSRWLVGAGMGDCFFAGDGVFYCELERFSTGTARVAWNTRGPATFTVPAGWGITAGERLDGGVETVGATVLLDDEPVLLRGSAGPWDYAPNEPVRFPPSATVPCAAGDAAAEVLASGPIAWYRLGELDGGTVSDSSPAKNHASLLGGREVPQPVRGALKQRDDGAARFSSASASTANAVSVPVALNPWAQPFSIELWAQVDDFRDYQMALVREAYGVSGFRFAPQPSLFSVNAGTWTFWTSEGGGDIELKMTVPVRVGEWHHYVVTFEWTDEPSQTGRFTLYVDGVRDGAAVGKYVPPPGGLLVGAGAGYAYRGALDEVAIFSHALTADEVRAHAEAGSGRCGALQLPR